MGRTIQNYNTLIACLPNKSKEILHQNEIIISTPTSKPPLFNHVTFIKTLSISEIHKRIGRIEILQNCDNNKRILVTQEVFKMFMNQITLKKLEYYFDLTCVIKLTIRILSWSNGLFKKSFRINMYFR